MFSSSALSRRRHGSLRPWISRLASARTFLGFGLLTLSLTTHAEPERELRQQVTALARTSYSWETTVRQRFTGDSTQPRLDPKAPVELRGRIDPESYTAITLMPTREFPVALTAISRWGDVVVQTPNGWVRRADVRPSTGADREVSLDGKQVRASRFVSAALKVGALRPLTEELLDLLPELKNHRVIEGLILADIRDESIERLWGDAQAKRAPELHGTVIFKLSDDGLAEVHVVLGVGFPNSRTKTVAWSLQQWTTRIQGIGTTTVEPPADAAAVLEQ